VRFADLVSIGVMALVLFVVVVAALLAAEAASRRIWPDRRGLASWPSRRGPS
jgi:hypothetical protein